MIPFAPRAFTRFIAIAAGPVTMFNRPPKGIIAILLETSMEFLESGRLEQGALTTGATELPSGIFRQISDAAMHHARRTESGRVVRHRLLLHFCNPNPRLPSGVRRHGSYSSSLDDHMAPRFVNRSASCGWTESRRVHAQRFEQPFADDVFPRLPQLQLHGMADDYIIRVVVFPHGARLCCWRMPN